MPKKLTKDDFISRATKVHGDTYDYSEVVYKGSKTKVSIVCPKHGSFDQTPNAHLRAQGCPRCKADRMRNENMGKEKFVVLANKVHNNKYDYQNVVYKNNKTPINIICPIHGDFEQTPNTHLRGSRCPRCAITKGAHNRAKLQQDFLDECKKIHGDKYDYSRVDYKGRGSNIKIVCPAHGEFIQNPHTHWGGHGCPDCGGKKQLSVGEFIKRAYSTHGNTYTYHKSTYGSTKIPTTITCSIHGDFEQTPETHWRGHGCPSCSISVSSMEQEINQYITSELGIDTQTRNRKLIKPYELDILIPDRKIAIELDGLYWHSTAIKADTKYHLKKTDMCEAARYRLIHIYEDEWRDNRTRIESFLGALLNPIELTKYHARKCCVQQVTTQTAKDFLSRTHIQGCAKSSVRLGLFTPTGQLIAYMGLVRTPSDGGYNLNRFATDGLVRGGFSKLLKFFINEYMPTNIISYADRRWSQGGVYERAGFALTKKSSPSFDYMKNGTRYNRQNFMKYKLKDKLPFFDPSLTEKENMEHNGFYQIWNCGYLKFEMRGSDKY